MSSIKAKVLEIDKFYNDCKTVYSAILNIAYDILSDVENYHRIVELEHNKISRQVLQAESLVDKIQAKVISFRASMELARAEEERYNDEISYIHDNPIIETKTDSDGNEISTSTIDYDALSIAMRGKEEAALTYRTYDSRCEEAEWLAKEAEFTLSSYRSTERIIELAADSIYARGYEIKKYISAITEETQYNEACLAKVLASLRNYLASKAIFMPLGASYTEFVGASFGGKQTDFMPSSDINSSADDHVRFVDIPTVKYDIDSSSLYVGTSGEKIENNVERYENSEVYEECLKYAGIYGDYDTQLKMVTALKSVINNSSLSMRVHHDVLSKILSDGKFKNFFETNTTQGVFDREGRLSSSNYLFGTDLNIKAEGFEKFGYLDAVGSPEKQYYPMGQYGGVVVNFKKNSVNATFTCTDSLSFHQNTSNGGIGCPIDNPSLCSMNKFQLKIFADAIKSGIDIPKSACELSDFLSKGDRFSDGYKTVQYLEVQYHGDLKIEDIESITFISNYGTPSEKITSKLAELGIKYNVCNI